MNLGMVAARGASSGGAAADTEMQDQTGVKPSGKAPIPGLNIGGIGGQ